ncbi:DUF3455 domain-containing protein [Bradyrhizobium sp. IC3195]|uniref:DUF3455 domain-containing protein n=1 Tax=Bradyrhizobium sp. IC3195 TaxID=2793804 RepID=UPI0023EEE0C2|nr:DUF3455 domain-containing protein [Bradyrhizobium sp. IC3195]
MRCWSAPTSAGSRPPASSTRSPRTSRKSWRRKLSAISPDWARHDQGPRQSAALFQFCGPRAEMRPCRSHYAGPNCELADGSAVTGKAAGNAPGATAADIPWLKLNVTSHRGSGTLTPVTTVQRINTHGGKLDGACDKAGEFRSAPYSADYVFLKRAERSPVR